MPKAPPTYAFRAEILHFIEDPAVSHDALEHLPDGLLIVRDGHVAEIGPTSALRARLPDDLPVRDLRPYLLLPGFVDCHTHFAQTDCIASDGGQLLEWLARDVFPTERALADPALAEDTANFFCDELLRHGSTTALVFSTVHATATEALFAAAARRNMRLITGKCLMDRHCPSWLSDAPDDGMAASRTLIARWHGRQRLAYAVSPRFAPACSDAQMRAAAALLRELPDLYLHTHVAENRAECQWAHRLAPWARSYLDIYHQFAQIGPRSVLAHGIWLDGLDRQVLADTGAAIAFCPSANLFLGSGLFDLAAADAAGVRVGIGTDVGAGTSFSMLRTLGEAYKVLQLQSQPLSARRAFYLATLGGARSLRLDRCIGNFSPAKEADFVLLDPAPDRLIARRLAACRTLEERLFVFMTLGDAHCIAGHAIMGDLRLKEHT